VVEISRYSRERISSCGKRWFVRSDHQGSRFFWNLCLHGVTCQKYECSCWSTEGTREYIIYNSQRWTLLELGKEKLVQDGRVKTYGSGLRLINCLDCRGTTVRFPAKGFISNPKCPHRLTDCGPTRPPMQLVPGSFSVGVKRLSCI
jgi:hypothetical protein